MAETRRFSYESMFLLPQSATADLNGAIEHIREIFKRAKAEVLAMRKWDERRLAYEIQKHKRGLYILVYFTCDADKLAHIERDCNLSETIMRTLVIRADHLSVDEMRAQDASQALADEAALRRERGAALDTAQDETEPAGVGIDEDED